MKGTRELVVHPNYILVTGLWVFLTKTAKCQLIEKYALALQYLLLCIVLDRAEQRGDLSA